MLISERWPSIAMLAFAAAMVAEFFVTVFGATQPVTWGDDVQIAVYFGAFTCGAIISAIRLARGGGHIAAPLTLSLFAMAVALGIAIVLALGGRSYVAPW